MRFTISREKLQEGLAAVTAAVPAKTTLPVLSNLLVETTERGIRFSATDLDIAVSTEVSADVETPGAITIPAKKLSEIARELGMTLTEYQSALNEARGAQLVYFEDIGGNANNEEDYLERNIASALEGGGDPGALLADKRFRNSLIAAIENLPEREKQLMGMYYEQDMNLREIGAVMGVTESRVCQ
jgi:hypothetical protein